jgi:hypothetical protein
VFSDVKRIERFEVISRRADERWRRFRDPLAKVVDLEVDEAAANSKETRLRKKEDPSRADRAEEDESKSTIS